MCSGTPAPDLRLPLFDFLAGVVVVPLVAGKSVVDSVAGAGSVPCQYLNRIQWSSQQGSLLTLSRIFTYLCHCSLRQCRASRRRYPLFWQQCLPWLSPSLGLIRRRVSRLHVSYAPCSLPSVMLSLAMTAFSSKGLASATTGSVVASAGRVGICVVAAGSAGTGAVASSAIVRVPCGCTVCY